MKKFYFTVFLCLLSHLCVVSQTVLQIEAPNTIYDIGKGSVTYLPKNILSPHSIKEVLPLVPQFVPLQENTFPICRNGNATWLKFTLNNRTGSPLFLEVYPLMADSVAIYAMQNDGSFIFNQTGILLPFRERGLVASNQNLPLLGKDNEPQTYFMRIISSQPMGSKIRVATYEEMTRKFHQTDIANGLIFGILSLIILFNILMYFAQQDIVYIWYSLYLANILLLLGFYNGFFHEYFYPNRPYTTRYLFLPLNLGIIFSNVFSIYFLDIKKMSPYCYNALMSIVALHITVILLGFDSYFAMISLQVILFTSVPSIFIGIVAAFKNIAKGNYSAWFYIFGWASLGISIIVYLIDTLFNVFKIENIQYVFYIGIGLEAIILTLAIFYRINNMRKEQQKANKLAFKAMQEKQNFIAEQNHILEKSVLERTHDLQEALMREQQIEQQIREYAKKLEHSNHELTDFAHLISHDLRAPLRNIASFAELLRRRNETKFTVRDNEFMNFIIKGSKQATQLVEDLLNFAKIDKDLGEPQTLFLCKILDTVRFNLDTMIAQKRGVVNCGLLPVLKAHSALVTQLFQNLISNGLKYNENPEPMVQIGFLEKDESIIFFVKDNGIGIPPQYLQEVFKMFRRLHTAEQYEGSGIGLAFCKKIVENYNGDIWLESEPNKGTTFYFTLPDAQILSMNPREYMAQLTRENVATL